MELISLTNFPDDLKTVKEYAEKYLKFKKLWKPNDYICGINYCFKEYIDILIRNNDDIENTFSVQVNFKEMIDLTNIL